MEKEANCSRAVSAGPGHQQHSVPVCVCAPQAVLGWRREWRPTSAAAGHYHWRQPKPDFVPVYRATFPLFHSCHSPLPVSSSAVCLRFFASTANSNDTAVVAAAGRDVAVFWFSQTLTCNAPTELHWNQTQFGFLFHFRSSAFAAALLLLPFLSLLICLRQKRAVTGKGIEEAKREWKWFWQANCLAGEIGDQAATVHWLLYCLPKPCFPPFHFLFLNFCFIYSYLPIEKHLNFLKIVQIKILEQFQTEQEICATNTFKIAIDKQKLAQTDRQASSSDGHRQQHYRR